MPFFLKKASGDWWPYGPAGELKIVLSKMEDDGWYSVNVEVVSATGNAYWLYRDFDNLPEAFSAYKTIKSMEQIKQFDIYQLNFEYW